MKSKKAIKKMLEGYIVGRPKSRNRKINNINVFFKSEYGAITVYAYDMKDTKVLFKKLFYSSWFDAMDYYYNIIETKIKR